MTKPLLALLFCCLCLTSNAQIAYENAYFITNSGERIDCLIKNVDWKNNPDSFEYKISENGPLEKGLPLNVKEFGFSDGTKFIGTKVKIDRSSDLTEKLSYEKQPDFNDEALFLKVLVEGSAKLHGYTQEGLRRFYLQMGNGAIEPLVYKKYSTDDAIIRENVAFRQKLLNTLECNSVSNQEIANIKYTTKTLVKLFQRYNKCMDSGYEIERPEQKKTKLNLWLNPSVTSNNFKVSNGLETQYTFDFPSTIGLRLGTALELVLPYNKNKWSVFVEPTYQKYTSDRQVERSFNFSEGDIFDASITYSSIELPVGVRHYMFLNDLSKLSIEVAFVHDFTMNSNINIDQTDDLTIDSNENFAFGIGYVFKNTFQFQIRYQLPRNILDNYVFWSSEFTTLNFTLGYRLL